MNCWLNASLLTCINIWEDWENFNIPRWVLSWAISTKALVLNKSLKWKICIFSGLFILQVGWKFISSMIYLLFLWIGFNSVNSFKRWWRTFRYMHCFFLWELSISTFWWIIIYEFELEMVKNFLDDLSEFFVRKLVVKVVHIFCFCLLHYVLWPISCLIRKWIS